MKKSHQIFFNQNVVKLLKIYVLIIYLKNGVSFHVNLSSSQPELHQAIFNFFNLYIHKNIIMITKDLLTTLEY